MKHNILSVLNLLLGFSLIVTSVVSYAASDTARLNELISKIDQDDDLDALSVTEKEAALDYLLKEKAKRPDDSTWSDKQLLQLAHEPTIQRYAERMKLGFFGNGEVGSSRQPRMIEFCENSLMKKEPVVPAGGSDVPAMSESLGTAEFVLRITQDAREMPGETRVWAQRLKRLIEQNLEYVPSPKGRRIAEESRLIVRNWFTENKAALQAREFAKVKPGALHTLQKEAEPPALGEEPRNVLASATPTPTPNIPPPETKTTGKIQGGYWAFAILGLCIALLAAGIYLSVRSNRSK